MFVQDTGFGSLKDVRDSLKNFAKAASQPIKNVVKNPKSLLDPRNEWKTGLRMGKSLEKVAVSLNPLNPAMKKLDEAGIKAGRKGNVIAKFLGRVGEKARTKPIATTAIVYGAVLATAKGLAAKGASAAAGKAGAGAGASGVTTGATGAATGGAGSGLTTTGLATYGGSALTAAGKVVNLLDKDGGEGEEIDPFAADAELALTDESGRASQIASNISMAGVFSKENLLLFFGLGTLTAAGYMLFNQKPKRKMRR